MIHPASPTTHHPRPTALLYMTGLMRERCLRPQDLERLRGACHLIEPTAAAGDDLPAVWQAHAAKTDILITGWHTPPIVPAMLDAAPLLKLILHAAGSVRTLLPDAVFERGIRVASANSALARGVAETTLGLTIIGLKGIIPASRMVAAGGWKRDDFETPGVRVRETFGSVVGVIGVGQVGRHLIQMLHMLGVEVLVADPHLPADDADALGVTLVELPDLLSRSDVVSLCAPALPSTRGMIGETQLQQLKDGAVFINTARGSLVDESALVAELKRGRIWAFLDVSDPEPPARNHPLRSLPNVTFTPHLAGAVNNGCLRLGADITDQLLAYVAGQPLSGELPAAKRSILA